MAAFVSLHDEPGELALGFLLGPVHGPLDVALGAVGIPSHVDLQPPGIAPAAPRLSDHDWMTRFAKAGSLQA
jgi:hypothetical protein